MSYAERIAKGSMIVFAMTMFGTLLGYILRLYLSRKLDVEDFGLFYAILTFISFFIIFGIFGFKESLIKHIPEFIVKRKEDKIKSSIAYVLITQIIIMGIISIILFVSSDFLAVAYFGSTEAATALKIMSIYAIFAVLLHTMVAALVGLGKAFKFSSTTPLNNILIFSIVIIFSTITVADVSYAYLLATIILVIFFYIMLMRSSIVSKTKLIFNRSLYNKIFLFSVPAFIISIFGTWIKSIDTFFLTYFRTLEEVGFYQVALPTSRLLLVFYSSIVLIIFPIFSEMWTKRDKEGIAKTLSFILKYTLILIVPFVLLAIAFPDLIIRMLFGQKYVPAAPALQILSVSVIFFTLYSLISTTLVAIGKVYTALKLILIFFVVSLIINLILIPPFGIIGAAIANIVSFSVGFLVYFFRMKKEIKIIFRLSEVFKIIILSSFILFLMTTLKTILISDPWVELVISVPTSIIIYLYLLIITKTITKRDLQILNKSKIRIPLPIKKFFYNVVKA